MDKFIIEGGVPLKGEFTVRGSKNAVSKMMVASLLTDAPCVLENVPLSAETDITKELCEHFGSIVEINPATHQARIVTKEVSNSRAPELSRKNRIPILAIGPLLHRKGIAELPVLGGCPIGHRPIDFHIEGLKKLGAYIQRREHSYYASARELIGAKVTFPYPSVGATENIILAATLAKGNTNIHNAATEPEIIALCDMLGAMGANITIDEARRTITVKGVKKLHGATARVIPDRNEVVSIASAALATNGDVFVPEMDRKYLEAFLQKLTEIGAHYEITSNGIRFFGNAPYKATVITTSPHPGFMTDWQQPFAVVLTQAQGSSSIHETVYDDRLAYVTLLQEMGASTKVSKDCINEPCRFEKRGFVHSAIIKGPTTLRAHELIMPDMRAGMALIIAALSASGTSILDGIEHIDRGYENLEKRLQKLGARIRRLSV